MTKEMKRKVLETFIKYAIEIAMEDWEDRGPYKDHTWGEGSIGVDIIDEMLAAKGIDEDSDEYDDVFDEVDEELDNFIEKEMFKDIKGKKLDQLLKLYIKGDNDD